MSALPKPDPERSAPAVPPAGDADRLAASLRDAVAHADAAPGAPPPHVLWATLESAYTEQPAAPMREEERLPPYLALPLAVGLSLILWAIIVAVVLVR
jgi:hypothetical protein